MITVNGKDYDNKKAARMLGRGHIALGKAILEELHGINGNDGVIAITSIDLNDGIFVDALTPAKINKAAADLIAQIAANEAAHTAEQEANVARIVQQREAEAAAFDALIASKVDARLAELGVKV